MQIGNVIISGNVLLAPMCDVTNLPFRLMCKRYGAALVYSEMIHADAFIHHSEKTMKRSNFIEEERPIGIQLTGSNIGVLEKAATQVEQLLKPDFIDINFGCPAYNVMKHGSGAAYLSKPEKLGKVISKLVGAVSIPITCKMRILPSAEATILAAKIIEQCGAKALTVHGRTAKQMYSGNSNWSIIAKIKQQLNIPVILNGDVVDESSAKQALDSSQCDAIMIGRAAIGNPSIFERINHYLATEKMLPQQTIVQKLDDLLMFLNLCKKHNYKQIKSIKMYAQYAIKKYPGARHLRRSIAEAKSIKEIQETLTPLAEHDTLSHSK